MLVIHVEGYGDFKAHLGTGDVERQRSIEDAKAVAEARFLAAGWTVCDVRPGLCSITEYANGDKYPATGRWALVVEYDGDWQGLGWSRESAW